MDPIQPLASLPSPWSEPFSPHADEQAHYEQTTTLICLLNGQEITRCLASVGDTIKMEVIHRDRRLMAKV